MLDEVQTGNGRTGSWFAYQNMGFEPDVVTTAKGLGNGVPIGACLARGQAAHLFHPGHHGSTYGGNPLVSSAALAVMDAIDKKEMYAHVTRMGALIREVMERELAASGRLTQIRGRGLMLGFQLDRDCPELVKLALDDGLLINVTAGNTVRLLPPLNITEAQATELAEGVAHLILGL